MIRKLFATTLVLLISSPAWSYTITSDNINVGGLDMVLDATTDLNSLGDCGMGSNPSNETCWAEFATGEDLTYDGTKIDPVTAYVTNEDATVIAFSLDTGEGYYIVKNSNGWVLLSNEILLSFGVFDIDTAVGGTTVREVLNLCNGRNGCEDSFTISHVTPLDGGDDMRVPEPAPLALLGLGLLGIALTRRATLG